MKKRVIIEGVDKVGKTFLKKFLQQATDYAIYVQDRGEISQEIYNNYFHRDSFTAKIDDDTFYVLLYCSCNDELKFRLGFDKDSLDYKTVSECQDKFIEYFDQKSKYRPNFLYYDISEEGFGVIANDIIKHINATNKCR